MKDENKTVLLTRKATKDFLDISFSTLAKWTKEKKLKRYSIGNKIYYKKKEIIESLIEI